MVRIEYIKCTISMTDVDLRTREVKFFDSKEEAHRWGKNTNGNPKSLFKVFALKEVDQFGTILDWV
jgi:hypothetical protein|tara:strand:- start:115 stop:312 length:198 start_codon:yes stop_codon:yes gene_type:complete